MIAEENIASMVRGWHQQGVFIALVDDQLEVFGEPSVVQQYAAAIRQHKKTVVACMKTAQEQRTRLETLALASWCKPDCKHLLRSKMASGEQALWCRQYRNSRSWSQQRLCILRACPKVTEQQALPS